MRNLPTSTITLLFTDIEGSTRLTSIYSKIGVSSRSAAMRYAIEHHLV